MNEHRHQWSNEFIDVVNELINEQRKSFKIDPYEQRDGLRYRDNKRIFRQAMHYLMIEREANGFNNHITLEIEATSTNKIKDMIDAALKEAAETDEYYHEKLNLERQCGAFDEDTADSEDY